MKSLDPPNGSGSCKKSPWRRKYQHVKVSSLLQAPQDACYEEINGCTDGKSLPGAQERGHKRVRNGRRKPANDVSEFFSPPTPPPPSFSSSALSLPVSLFKLNGESEKAEIGRDEEENEKSKEVNGMFEKYLFVDKDLIENGKEESKNRVLKEKRKKRSERRHTVTGTSSISVTEIESWISNVSKPPRTANCIKLSSHSQDDSELFLARPKIIRTRLAEKLPSFGWERSKNERAEEKKKDDMHRWFDEVKKKNSCSPAFDDELHYDVTRREQDISKDINSYSFAKDAASRITAFNAGDILTRGINNSLNCFLTPTSSDKGQVFGVMATEARKSWNGFDVTIEPEIQRRNSNGDLQITRHEDDFQKPQSLDEDYDAHLVRNRTRKPQKPSTQYDTFLDLSRLPIDDQDVGMDNGSFADQLTSSSDRGSSFDDDYGRYYDVDSDDCYEGYDLERGNCGFEENIDGIVQSVVGTTLDRIEEVEEPEEGITDAEDQVLETANRNFDNNGIAENENGGFSRENAEGDNNASKTAELHENGIAEYEDTAGAETDINMQEEETNVIENGEIPDANGAESTKLQNENDSDRASSSNDHSSMSSDDESDCFYDTISGVNKTTSLDRNLFRKTDTSNSEQLDRDKSDGDKKCADIRTNSSADKISNLRSGMKPLFRIAMSTVDATSRPGAKIRDVLDLIESKGIKLSDPRLKKMFRRIEEQAGGPESPLNFEVFSRVCEPSFKFVRGVLLSQLTIPGFNVFKMRMADIFESIQELLETQDDVVQDIDPSSDYSVVMRNLGRRKARTSMSVCTVDGQRCSYGDTETPHPLNACAQVFNYCLACRQNGIEAMTSSLGRKPKPSDVSEFSLRPDEKVWNPFTKLGSILTTTFLFRDVAVQSRLEPLQEFYASMTGHEPVCCDNLSYNYKRSYAHEEIGLAYFLSATQRMPCGAASDISDTIDLHFQSVSSAMTSDACAVAAATLANGGVCAITDETIFKETTVTHCLNVIRSSRDNSKPPSKQHQDIAVTWNDYGSLFLVVPGVLGLTCFVHCRSSDVMDKLATRLVESLNSNFNFSVYRSLKDRRNVIFRR
ncbi:unnamed protein product [Clavelina lepadiformis]|uniref:glutaminase n=1 Tax=Clavelina lepadiformis TaxID=159417 RepID=A0ABP0FQS9_CLALP